MTYQVKIKVKDPDLGRSFAEVFSRESEFKATGPSDTARPDLLIYEIEGSSSEKELELLESILAGGKVEEVFVISKSTDPSILMRAMRIGIKEFFPVPFEKEEIAAALHRFAERRMRKDQPGQLREGKIFSVVGSKGGIGTTTVAVNLAVSLAERAGKDAVALLDMNAAFGDIPLFMDLAPKYHWGEITKNAERLDEIFLREILSKHPTGVNVLPSPGHLNGHRPATPEIVQRLLGHLKNEFAYTVIDGGQSEDVAKLRALQLSDSVLMVSVLSLPCLSNTNKLIGSLENLGYVSREKIKVVVNRFERKSEISIEDAEKGLGTSVFYQIPNDYKTSMAAINQGKPVKQVAPKSEMACSIDELAEKLAPSQTESRKRRKWLFFKD